MRIITVILGALMVAPIAAAQTFAQPSQPQFTFVADTECSPAPTGAPLGTCRAADFVLPQVGQSDVSLKVGLIDRKGKVMWFRRGALLRDGAGLGALQSAQPQVRGTRINSPDTVECSQPLGTVAIAQPETPWWQDLGLANPSGLVAAFATQTNCFRVIQRGAALNAASTERELNGGAGSMRGSNIGMGQIRTADFLLSADLAGSPPQSTNFGLPGGFGAIAGAIKTRPSPTATVSLVDLRTTEEVLKVEGRARPGGFGIDAAANPLGAQVGGGYSDTTAGRTVAAAYNEALTKLVLQIQRDRAGNTAVNIGSPNSAATSMGVIAAPSGTTTAGATPPASQTDPASPK